MSQEVIRCCDYPFPTHLLIRHSVPVLLQPASKTRGLSNPVQFFVLPGHPPLATGYVNQAIVVFIETSESVQYLLLRIQFQQLLTE